MPTAGRKRSSSHWQGLRAWFRCRGELGTHWGLHCPSKVTEVDSLNPWVFTGLLFGAMTPYAFAAWAMESAVEAVNDMVKECMEQFPKIINGNRARLRGVYQYLD